MQLCNFLMTVIKLIVKLTSNVLYGILSSMLYNVVLISAVFSGRIRVNPRLAKGGGLVEYPPLGFSLI